MEKVPRDRIAGGIWDLLTLEELFHHINILNSILYLENYFPYTRDLNFFSSLNLGILMAFRTIFPSDNPPNIHGEKSRPGLHISLLSSCLGPCLLCAGLVFSFCIQEMFFLTGWSYQLLESKKENKNWKCTHYLKSSGRRRSPAGSLPPQQEVPTCLAFLPRLPDCSGMWA